MTSGAIQQGVPTNVYIRSPQPHEHTHRLSKCEDFITKAQGPDHLPFAFATGDVIHPTSHAKVRDANRTITVQQDIAGLDVPADPRENGRVSRGFQQTMRHCDLTCECDRGSEGNRGLIETVA
jgi:hypothetical protein